MFLRPDEFKKILLRNKIISAEKFQKYLEQARKKGKNITDFILESKIISEQELSKMLSEYFHIPYIDLQNKQIPKNILSIIPEPIAKTHKIIAFEKTRNDLKVAMLDPRDLQTIEFIKKKTNLEVKLYITTPKEISNALHQYRSSLKARMSLITETDQEGKSIEELKNMAHNLPIVKIVDSLLEYAIFENASDVHIEPQEKELIVRYRIDGILKEVMNFSKNVLPAITARIKVLASLKLDEHRLPQDGRFKMEKEGEKISFRVSIIPTFYGEKTVMRLLNESKKIPSLIELGISEYNLKKIQRNIKKPHGMILVTGPTGSGKTTTLYSILNILNSSEVNISTVEDPIEYQMPHINQTQVEPKIGLTFANGLRSLLRQDPDIIMIGEIRDNETAEMSINASLTGHLVLSTLHTNDAATAFPRLLDMQVEPFLIASTVNIIIAQRLIRKICMNCIESYELDKEMLAHIEERVDTKTLLAVMAKEGIITHNQKLRSLLFYRGSGCTQCDKKGYKGRVGIYEVIEKTSEIEKLIIANTSGDKILKAAQATQGMTTLLQDGFIKAKMGMTTIEEILRTTQE